MRAPALSKNGDGGLNFDYVPACASPIQHPGIDGDSADDEPLGHTFRNIGENGDAEESDNTGESHDLDSDGKLSVPDMEDFDEADDSPVCSDSMDGDSDSPQSYTGLAYIEGVRIVVETHASQRDIGARVVCPVHGSTCRAFRSFKMWEEHHGKYAAIQFLGCWIKAASTMDVRRHRKHRPTRQQVNRYIGDVG